MWRFDRYTARRGTAADPVTCLRTRSCGARGPGASSRRPLLRPLGGLPGLLADELALVPDPLALVGLGLADLPDVRGGLAHQLLVDAPDGDPGRRGDLELDPLRRPHVHGVGEPQGQLEVRLLQDGPVPHPHDLQSLLVALGHALHHVRDQRAGEPVEAAVESIVRGPLDDHGPVLLGDLDLRMEGLLQGAAGAGHGHARAVDHHVDAPGDLDWLPPDPAHRLPHTYQTYALTSPPSPAREASRSVIRPRDVDTMAMPRPPMTRGSPSRFAYTRRPGLDTRLRPVMVRSRPLPYFSVIRIADSTPSPSRTNDSM